MPALRLFKFRAYKQAQARFGYSIKIVYPRFRTKRNQSQTTSMLLLGLLFEHVRKSRGERRSLSPHVWETAPSNIFSQNLRKPPPMKTNELRSYSVEKTEREREKKLWEVVSGKREPQKCMCVWACVSVRESEEGFIVRGRGSTNARVNVRASVCECACESACVCACECVREGRSLAEIFNLEKLSDVLRRSSEVLSQVLTVSVHKISCFCST